MTRYLLIITSMVMFCHSAMATDYYVAKNGSDSNPGTEALPWANIQKAAHTMVPGDTVYVKAGTYSVEVDAYSHTLIYKSGNSANWIKYRNYGTDRPVLQVTKENGFRLEDACYIEIRGFELTVGSGSSAKGTGIQAVGTYDTTVKRTKGHHVRFIDNKIHDFGGGGINAYRYDYVTVENNLVYGNAKRSSAGASGVSFYQLTNYDGSTSYHNFIRRNRCYDNVQTIITAGDDKITDGNGIIIDDSQHTQKGYLSTAPAYTASTRIENNVVHYNGGRGIHCFHSDHVDAIFNTAFQNQRTNAIRPTKPEDGGMNDGELSASLSNDIRFANNIAFSRSGKKCKSDPSGSANVWEGNLYYAGTYPSLGTGEFVANPLFVNSSQSNFHLQSTSPAIDRAIGWTLGQDFDGNARPKLNGYDIGAFEYQGATTAAATTASAPTGNG